MLICVYLIENTYLAPQQFSLNVYTFNNMIYIEDIVVLIRFYQIW